MGGHKTAVRMRVKNVAGCVTYCTWLASTVSLLYRVDSLSQPGRKSFLTVLPIFLATGTVAG